MSATATKTKPPAMPVTMETVAQAEFQEAHDARMPFVRDDDKSLGVDDYKLILAPERTLGYPAGGELFHGDKIVYQERAEMWLTEFDHTDEDAEDEKLLKLLEEREARRKNRKPASRREIPMTIENAERLLAESNQSITIRNRAINLLHAEFYLRQSDRTPGGILTAKALEIGHEKKAIENTLRLARTIEQANPRLFRGDYGDKRPAWDSLQCQQAIDDPTGELLRGRLEGRDVKAVGKSEYRNLGDSLNNVITATPYHE